MNCVSLSAALLLLLLERGIGVDRANFKTCDQSGFCRRHRNQNTDTWNADTLEVDGQGLAFRVRNAATGHALRVQLQALSDGHVIRMRINEIESQRTRFEARDALLDHIVESKLELRDQTADGFVASSGPNRVAVTFAGFRVDAYSGDRLVLSANQRSLFRFERFRTKESASADDDCSDACWDETFKSHVDSKPFGPMSVGADFTFVDFEHVYGIPEHADRFALKNTRGVSDPYRLYNVDIFEYEPETPMSLYGAVPLMVAHAADRTVGLLWLNPSETWIDIEDSSSGFSGMLSTLVSGHERKSRQTHWISEAGVVDAFFLFGPTAADVMAQNARLTGSTPLPPLYAIGYHQCRWNYWSQNEVNDVDNEADAHDMPLDAIWLDIEYTDGRSKKYFTWDALTFGDARTMVSNLTAKGRRLITIIDPHIKKDTNYHVYNEGVANGYFTKDKNDQDFEGWCWPGSSSWADYANPAVREWWADKFAPQHFPGFDGLVDIWNDMNEPSVFSGPEVTAPRDMKHWGGVEHRELHNMYGLLMTKATYAGLERHRPEVRPFILTRSFFAGSQRYAAVWTGDNMSKWEHLRMTTPMLLSHVVAGITFVGADIPGFFFNPESEELVVRWYQASVLHPFFRGHAHLDTKRREPWTFSDATKAAIRDVLRVRYAYLPLMYALFYENELNGMPAMRPLWFPFPDDARTFAIDNAYMLGDALLVHPVQDKGATSAQVYFPTVANTTTTWMHVFTRHTYTGGNSHTIDAQLTSIPIFQRSGTIVPKRERIRRSALLSVNDPISLEVFVDIDGAAVGALYLDDGQSFRYRSGDHVFGRLSFAKKVLTYEQVSGRFDTKSWLERVSIFGLASKPSRVLWTAGDRSGQLAFKYDDTRRALVIRKPALTWTRGQWSIKVT